MITNQEVASRDDGASPKAAQNPDAVPSSRKDRTIPTERVIAAFTAAAGTGTGARGGAFDAAVRAYIACYPDTCWDVAARIVADIISHREA